MSTNSKELSEHCFLPVCYSIDENFDSDKFIRLRLDFAHDGLNFNRSRFTKELLYEKRNSLFLSPVLGHITQDSDGTYHFGGHDFEFRPDPYDNDRLKMYYLETVLGIIPPEEYANFEVKEVDGVSRVSVDAYLYKDYSNFAEDILKEQGSTSVSMEIDILKYTYDAKENICDIEDFKYKGITFLDTNVQPAMANANAVLYSAQEQEISKAIMFKDPRTIFNELFSELSQIYGKGGNNMEIKDTVNVAAEDVSAPENVTDTPDTSVGNAVADTDNGGAVAAAADEQADVQSENKLFTVTYSLSHEDIKVKLYKALRDGLSENENQDIYWISEVFDGYFDYKKWDSEDKKLYRQKYTVDTAGNVAFDGERFEVYVIKVTAEEKAALEMLQTKYSEAQAEIVSLKAFKDKCDAEEKKAVYEKWADKIGQVDEYKALAEKYSAMETAEIETACKVIFADNFAFAPSGNFSAVRPAVKTGNFDPVAVGITDKQDAPVSSAPYNGFIEEYTT